MSSVMHPDGREAGLRLLAFSRRWLAENASARGIRVLLRKIDHPADAPEPRARTELLGGPPTYTRAMSENPASKMNRLLEIMARLRDPKGGCPWDLEQDFSSISPHTIEEAYEVDEAIASGDLESLRDELGDLLFQVVFQSRIAEELGVFDFAGVTEAITSKLIRRHPHIFADAATPATVGDQVSNWESIKAEERAAADRSRGGPSDPFVGIPRNLPALARSVKLAGRLARIEWEGDGPTPVGTPPPSDGILSELTAMLAATQHRLDSETCATGDREATLRLVGAGLRAWVWLARELGVDPEQALRLVDDETVASVRGSIQEEAGRARTRAEALE
jgi:ATP diphosphatase